MIAYKVFGYNNKKLVSAVAYGKAAVRYYVRRENKPPNWLARKGYGLLAFRTEQDARQFKHYCWGLYSQIRKVEGKVIKVKRICDPSRISAGKIKYRYWACRWPQGTIMMKSVKIISKDLV